MPARLEIADHIFDTLEDRMCKQIERHCIPVSKVEDLIITEDMDWEARAEREMDPFDAENMLAEHGCTICRLVAPDFRLTDCDTGYTAAGCTIDFLECVRLGGKRVGTFHTHPIGLPIPSHPDIKCSFEWKTSFDFVGGLVGGREVIVCYIPKDISEMKYEHLEAMHVLRNGVPIPNFPPGEPLGVIRFFREDPGPMASELLEDFDSIFPPEYYDEDQIKEFREELEGGDIPTEFWESYESSGEWDELKVYSDEMQREGFDDRLRELSNVFDVLVRWC